VIDPQVHEEQKGKEEAYRTLMNTARRRWPLGVPGLTQEQEQEW
jgi:hypothetical protein